MRYWGWVLVPIVLASCASTNRTKTLIAMGVAGAGGAAIGAATAPKTDSSGGHALLWGAVAAATAGAIGLFVFDEEKNSSELRKENESLKKNLDALNGGDTKSANLLYETNAPFGKDIPREYRNLISPGRWSVYGLNQWVMQGENTLVHQDKMVRLLPPEFNPKLNTEKEESSGK